MGAKIAEKEEITVELMTDLATAVRNVLSRTVPSLAIQINLYESGGTIRLPPGSLVIRPDKEGDPVYGHIIKARIEGLRVSDFLKDKPQKVNELVRELLS